MIRRVLVGAAHHPGVVLRCVLRVAGALRRVADQVQGPEDPVAEEQRPHEEERRELGLSLVSKRVEQPSQAAGLGVAGFLDGLYELLVAHLALVVGNLDGALLDVRVGVLTPESLFSSPSTAALQWPQLMSGP